MIKTPADLKGKTKDELQRLLDNVKTGTLSVQEKDYWVKEINSHLNLSTMDVGKAKKIYAEIQAGAADTDDINQGKQEPQMRFAFNLVSYLVFCIGVWMTSTCAMLLFSQNKICFCCVVVSGLIMIGVGMTTRSWYGPSKQNTKVF